MSMNNTPILYAGLDVAKASLQLDWRGSSHCLSNDAQGHARLRKLLGQAAGCHVVMEASGGYERGVAAALRSAGFQLSIVEPSKVRAFAHAKGQRAKTDAIDAAMIRSFGESVHPPATPAPSPHLARLQAVVSRRAQLVELKVMEQNHQEHYEDAFVQKQSAKTLAFLVKEIARCEAQIAQILARDAAMRAQVERLQQVPGIGPVVACTVRAFLPELGGIKDQTAAALAGVAPYPDSSGSRNGPRRIFGGRKAVRCALYLAALSAVRHDAIFKAFYTRLRDAGKKPLVALTAVMRKLICLLNRLLRDLNFQLLARPADPIHSPQTPGSGTGEAPAI